MRRHMDLLPPFPVDHLELLRKRPLLREPFRPLAVLREPFLHLNQPKSHGISSPHGTKAGHGMKSATTRTMNTTTGSGGRKTSGADEVGDDISRPLPIIVVACYFLTCLFVLCRLNLFFKRDAFVTLEKVPGRQESMFRSQARWHPRRR